MLARRPQINVKKKNLITLLDSSFFWTHMNGSKTVRSSVSLHHSTNQSWGAMSSSLPCNLIASMKYT